MRFLRPKFLILYQFLLIILAIAFPPIVYYYYMHETDIIYGNYVALLFVTLNLMAFYIGTLASYGLPIIKVNYNLKLNLSEKMYYGTPLIIVQTMVVLFILKFIKDNSKYLYLIFINASSYKEIITGNFFYFSIYMLIGVLFWVIKSKNFKKYLLLKILVLIAILEVLLSSILTWGRYLIIPFLIGLFVVYYSNYKKIRLKNLILAFSSGLGAFLFFGYFRLGNRHNSNISISYLFIRQLIGYTLASYNRLAGILNGSFTYSYGKTGFYLLPFLSHIPLLHHILPNFYEISEEMAWLQEFRDVASSGFLDPAFIWSTVYGYIFSVLAWLSPIYFMFIGTFTGWVWRNFLRNKTVGVIFYPWVYASLILAFSYNIMLYPPFISLVYSCIFICLWGLIFKPKTKEEVHLDC
jgi:hypothetical protein